MYQHIRICIYIVICMYMYMYMYVYVCICMCMYIYIRLVSLDGVFGFTVREPVCVGVLCVRVRVLTRLGAGDEGAF